VHWKTAPRFGVGPDTLEDPEDTVTALHQAWSTRQPVVIELAVAPQKLREPEIHEVEPYTLEPSFELWRERLHFLTWANNYDATKGEPIWWHGRLAQRLGAQPHSEAEVDFQGPRWCDGGPRGTVPFPVVHRESIEAKALALTLPLGVPEGATALDPEQLQAVHSPGGAARILAPAGSGKTRVLTGRFRYLLENGFEPSRISALAYNKRAAAEMISRLSAGAGSVRTLHAMGYGLLRRFRPGVKVASQAQVRQILRDLVRLAPQLNSDPWAPYLEALQRVRLALISPEEVEAESDEIPGFAKAFPRYRQRLASANLVDHDEQIYSCIELLLTNPQARKTAQAACTHLLVDEFQDLTPGFLLLIRLLSSPAYQVFGVGDDDQVIYGYCGATPDFLVSFDSYFPGAHSHQLKTNYRCPAGVVAAANHLLAHNQHRVPKEAVAASVSTSGPELILVPNEQWAPRALQQIELWLKQHKPHEIAVLARVNALLMPLQVLLEKKGIPHSKVVDETVLQRTGLRTALAYWRLCSHPQGWDPDDLSDALRRPNRMLRREIIEAASRCRDATGLRRQALKLDPWPASQIEEFLDDLSRLTTRVKRGPGAFFTALRVETAFTSALDTLDSAGLGSAGSSHRDDLLALEGLATLCDDDDFEEWLRGWLRAGVGDDQGIRLSTVHRVKGLEWPCVLIYGADAGLFPHRLAEEGEEERRIFHVAITRSQNQCVLLGSSQTISPFLAEMVAPPPPKKAKKKKKKKPKHH
jgi:DNA helicase-2/ATP-dependent DNA helicase PcrA